MTEESNLTAPISKGTALVIGGSGGIGAAICIALADAGNNVVLSYHSKPSAADKVVEALEKKGVEAHAQQVNMTDIDSIKAIVAEAKSRFGTIHSVVYAAGPPLEFLYINEIEPEEWSRVINADVNGCFNLVSTVLPILREQKGGSIVAVTTAAFDRAPPRDILSAAPKAAIQMLIKGVAREEGRFGIRANCVGPGFIEAGLGLATINEHTQSYVEKMTKAIPLKKPGKAEDVADVVTFMLSDKARYVTGEMICVAGGLQLS